MKHSILSKFFQLSILALMSYACTKDSPSTPVEPVRYEFTLENVSEQTMSTYNDDPAKPKENYKEITLAPAQKSTIKILSETGTTPMIRPSDPLSMRESLYDPATRTYQLDSFVSYIEISITGDVDNINIFFPNPITGAPDSMMSVKLPQVIKYSKATAEVNVIAQKQQVGGGFTLKSSVRDREVYSKIVSAPFGKLTTKTRAKEKSVTASVFEPDEWPCGTHNGNQLITGERGGCYYINKNGNKTYVDRSECSCN